MQRPLGAEPTPPNSEERELALYCTFKPKIIPSPRRESLKYPPKLVRPPTSEELELALHCTFQPKITRALPVTLEASLSKARPLTSEEAALAKCTFKPEVKTRTTPAASSPFICSMDHAWRKGSKARPKTATAPVWRPAGKVKHDPYRSHPKRPDLSYISIGDPFDKLTLRRQDSPGTVAKKIKKTEVLERVAGVKPSSPMDSHVPPGRVRHLFKKLDTDRSNGLDFEELTIGFTKEFNVAALAPHVMRQMRACFEMAATADKDGTKSLKINVFSRFYCEVLFRHFDADDSGDLQLAEVAAALKFLTKPNEKGEQITPVIGYPPEFTDAHGEVRLPISWFWNYFKSMDLVVPSTLLPPPTTFMTSKPANPNMPPGRVRHMFKKLDTDRSGSLDFEELTIGFTKEFNVAALAPHVMRQMRACFEMAATADKDFIKTGTMSLKINVFSRFYCEVLFRHFDADDSGDLQLAEVAAALKFLTKPNEKGEQITPVIAYPPEFTDANGEVHLPISWFWAYFSSMD